MKLLLLTVCVIIYSTTSGQKKGDTYNTKIEHADNVEIKIDKQYVIVTNQQRIIQPHALDLFIKQFPDTNTVVQFVSIGSPTREIINVSHQIENILYPKGYKNLYAVVPAFGGPIPDGIVFRYDSTQKLVWFDIPPIN